MSLHSSYRQLQPYPLPALIVLHSKRCNVTLGSGTCF